MIFFGKPVSTFPDHVLDSRVAIGAVGAAMDDFFYMLVLAALAIPVIAIAALVVALSQFSAIRRLDERLRALEFARAGAAAQGAAPIFHGSTPAINSACAGGDARVRRRNILKRRPRQRPKPQKFLRAQRRDRRCSAAAATAASAVRAARQRCVAFAAAIDRF